MPTGLVYLESPDPTLMLPTGVNCVFNLCADGSLVYTQSIVEVRLVFRPPSGFVVFEWQVEIVARSPVYRIELASTMRELNKE